MGVNGEMTFKIGWTFMVKLLFSQNWKGHILNEQFLKAHFCC